jgi:hypothetical protein
MWLVSRVMGGMRVCMCMKEFCIGLALKTGIRDGDLLFDIAWLVGWLFVSHLRHCI